MTSRAANWSWHHPDGQFSTMVAGGPVVDAEKNLFLMTMDGLWKFSPAGEVLWHYQTPGSSDFEPTISGDRVMSATTAGKAFAVDRHTGKEIWQTQLAEKAGQDVGYPIACEGVFLATADTTGRDTMPFEITPGGNRRLFGLSVATGQKLWDYATDECLYNSAPLCPGDGSTVIMDKTGSLYRLSLQTGEAIWKQAARDSQHSSTDGGAGLGPNGLVYTCSNYGNATGGVHEPGVVRAYHVETGHLEWEHLLPEPCCTFPAVGRIKGELLVIVTPGAFPSDFAAKPGSVLALDAATGQPRWEFNGASVFFSRGDVKRLELGMENTTNLRAICLPAQWSSPVITGDGSVYVGRSDGNIYVVHGPKDGTGLLESDWPGLVTDAETGVQAQVFHVGSAPVHGALAFAPEMMAFATCDSLYVWRT
ncbi:unnamed protein product [Effrenium voratum]|nr:unnamed protein product [Effrenium voratum]CAJ1437321.1 unnamed protein product [Effrenium voratum]